MKGIEFKNVSKVCEEAGSSFTALNNVSIRVEHGEFVAIIGPSGSGKSTFLSIAGALLKPTSGEVLVNDTDITKLNEKQLAKLRLKQIGFILQTSNLVPYLNVLDQLLVDMQYARELLDGIGLGEKLKKLPDQLSGGERQRTAIARAFMNNPDIILADEPTASLDSKRAFEIVELIAREVKNRNKAAIIVTHDERMLKYCDRVYQMQDGVLSLVEKAVVNN